MLRSLIKRWLAPAVTSFARWWFSTPDKKKVHASLDALYEKTERGFSEYTEKIIVGPEAARFVILSDQHKGIRNDADDFRATADNFCRALQFYYEQGFTLINNGDAEELWENEPGEIIEHNKEALEMENLFAKAHRYIRLFGNHDLEWKYPHQQSLYLHPIFGKDLKVKEGIFLQTYYRSQLWKIFIAHGHQGDHTSDGNAFSAWFVRYVWAPLQRYLGIQLYTTASSYELVDRHNIIMYEWSRLQPQLLLITGHTHKPVFASMDHIDRLNRQLRDAVTSNDMTRVIQIQQEIDQRKMEYKGKGLSPEKNRPCYFNTGCCCFADGDMTCIEWEEGMIRLVKWEKTSIGSNRVVLEETPLASVFDELMDSTSAGRQR